MHKPKFIILLLLLYAVQSFAGIEEISLHTMSEDWGASYNTSTKTLTFTDVVDWNKGRGWKFDWKYIDSSIDSYAIEFSSATTTAIAIIVKYSYNYTDHTKTFDFAAGVTSATIDMHTDFGSDTYSLDYILIKAEAACSIVLNRAYFTTTGNSDVYQAENTDYLGATLENLTGADNAIVPITDATHYVDFTISVPYTAVYRLNFGYSTKNGGAKTGNISINNGTGFSFDFSNTGESEVKEVLYSCVLSEGTNHIKVYANWTYFYIDYLRVYQPQLYLIGNIHESNYSWAANAGKLMTFDHETETFSCSTRIAAGDNQATNGTFAFATVLAENADGWSYMNGNRWGPNTDNLAVDLDGKTTTTDIEKRGDHSYVPSMAGTYTITVKADLSSFTIQGPEVYMFGVFEGTGYNDWAANKFSMMTYDADDEVYRLRTRIADGAETTGTGAVAFATAYCSTSTSDDWTYLNANRYGPSTDETPSIDGSANTIARNGATAFTGITAGKYEVVVDMFSATKAAKFYPLYTFGYEVEGTNAHGSIDCSTDDNEIPLGGTPTVTATPDEGYRFVKWTDDSDTQLSTSASYTPTISANTWLKAWFEPDPACSLTIPATDYAFAKMGDNIYTANGSPFFDNGSAVYFDYTANTGGGEVYYSVHLDAGTYYFYCTLSADGESRAFHLYEPSLSSGSLYYSGKRWNQIESHDFGSGEATFETDGFTVTGGDYLIGLYAVRNTHFSQIEVVGVCDGATDNTYALTLSAGANGSVISDQINNAKIVSGTNVLLLAEPASGYRFNKWSDENTDNPRSVTLSSALSLTASFSDASSACVNTLTIQCKTDSISPTTRPIASPKSTSSTDGILTNQEGEKSIYYAFEITETETCTITLLTPRSDKRQKIYLYSAQLEKGTSLTYSDDTYYQVQDPTDANSLNSGANHVYPICSTTLELAAGKYVIGLYSEYSWSQYDRIVVSAEGYGLDCSNADITINAGEQVELPYVVHDLMVHQGGSTTSSHDIQILNSITYIRPAYESREGGNKMNTWYPFCVPFSVSDCKVYDETDKDDYDIGAIYLKEGDAANNPTGTGYFYLEYLKEENLSALGNEFRTRWAYIEQALPAAYVPYIILFVNHWEDTNEDDSYFENNPTVKFIGGAQTIDGQAKIDNIADEGVEKYYYYANNTLSPIHLSSAYIYDPARNNFDYQEDVTIPPFECYIQATETYKARHKSIAAPRKPGKEDTTTGISSVMDEDEQIEVYDCMGHRVVLIDNRLPAGIWIVKQGANVRKIVVQ